MAKEFYYQVMGEVFGPINGVELRDKAVGGDLTPETLVRVGTSEDWVHARRLSNLFDEAGRGIPHEDFMQSLALYSASAFHEVPYGPPPQRLLEAVSFATWKHAGQLRKDGQTPYAAHPMRVAMILMLGFGVQDADVLTAGALHDVIEDTTADFDDIQSRFGGTVARYVAALTKDMRLPEEQREKAYMQQLIEAPVEVRLCKLADTYDNLLDSNALPKKSQMRTIRKADALLAQFTDHIPEPWRHALDTVRELIEKTSGGLIHHDG